MNLSKKYNPNLIEPRLQQRWQDNGIYHYQVESNSPVFSIDTPPPTVSGNLHLGHVYSYSHTDFIARFHRMRGKNVYYPMGYDDNGLPTERLVEHTLGISSRDVDRKSFIEQCLQIGQEAEKEYQELWQRLGLSVDWRYSYRTIDDDARKISQLSFIDLFHKGLVYRRKAPAIWCPECQTAIAQAELNDLTRKSEFSTLDFRLENDETLPIATTRPELLVACVAVFVHPKDERYQSLIGQKVTVPLFGQQVPILGDPLADPDKGTGAVMCCTFGDQVDILWWHTHKLPLIEAIDRRGVFTPITGEFAGLPVKKARQEIKKILQERKILLDLKSTDQSIRIHERCDTPVEYIIASQWFIRVMDFKEEFLSVGEKINWFPTNMKSRYRAWVENLGWDWCISRQRIFGVPFPVWYCKNCDETILAQEDQLPVAPLSDNPTKPCQCGSVLFYPEVDVMDTWATSSMTPQIVGQWQNKQELYNKVFPFDLRPQAHEIIRTWAFDTIVKSHFHFGKIPWKDVLISGWGIAGEGMGKISKSRGGGPMPPRKMIESYSADAVRYWASSTSLGKDSIISEEKIKLGAKLVIKLWNVARFSARFLDGYSPPAEHPPSLTPSDRWILSKTQSLIERVTVLFEKYEYAAAKSETETFFWTMADNYLEFAKQRLYEPQSIGHDGALYTIYNILLVTLKLFAPTLPFVTEEIYLNIFAESDNHPSIHTSLWPPPDPDLKNESYESFGEILLKIATAVRRYKSENNLPLGTSIERLELIVDSPFLARTLQGAEVDLLSVTRAQNIFIRSKLSHGLISFPIDDSLSIGILPLSIS